MQDLTIIMYHYVRPIKDSKYPGIKGLELSAFRRQLDYLENEFSIVNTSDVLNACKGRTLLPNNACWLTFDDGYKDHFKFVLPELLNRKLHGAFFPPRNAIEDDVVLDVNLIHHILSCTNDINNLVANLNKLCREHGVSEPEISNFYKHYAVPSRWDNGATIYVKSMLQHVLPENLRNIMAKELFNDIVGVSTEEFSKELYMDFTDIITLIKNGMYVGSHGSMHYWLNKISPAQQEKDIQGSLHFLERVGALTNDWVMCFPYGSYNTETLAILKKYGAKVGITTEVRRANLLEDDHLTLPRLDTNDFPQ